MLHVDTTPNTDQIYPAATEVVGNVASALSYLSARFTGQPRWAEGEVAAHNRVQAKPHIGRQSAVEPASGFESSGRAHDAASTGAASGSPN